MIVYKELSSLSKDLGYSKKTLYTVSNRIHKHYKMVNIPKSNGELRRLYVPDKLLKEIQRRINDKLLCLEPISPYATAYRPGGSTRKNAAPHVGKSVILKMDIRHFFDNLIYPIVKEKAFPEFRYSEKNRILLTLLCVYGESLPQGAPTSPAISNIIMREFDNAVGAWCKNNNIVYTRYCDDMTFSGDFDPSPVILFVKEELRKLGLYLNNKKTVVVKKGQKHSVTGIIVNESLHVSNEYKRKIRQEMYYCMKFGIASHLCSSRSDISMEKFKSSMLGRINYVLSVEPNNKDMLMYKQWFQNYKT